MNICWGSWCHSLGVLCSVVVFAGTILNYQRNLRKKKTDKKRRNLFVICHAFAQHYIGSKQLLRLLGFQFSADHQTCNFRTVACTGIPSGHREVPDLCKRRDLHLELQMDLNSLLQWACMSHGSPMIILRMSFAWWTECGERRFWEILKGWGNKSFCFLG